jgi:hypothetical protein
MNSQKKQVLLSSLERCICVAVFIVCGVIGGLAFILCLLGACIVFTRFVRAESADARAFAKEALVCCRTQSTEALEILKAHSLGEKMQVDLHRDQQKLLREQLLDSFNKEVEQIKNPKDLEVRTTDGRKIPFSRLVPIEEVNHE